MVQDNGISLLKTRGIWSANNPLESFKPNSRDNKTRDCGEYFSYPCWQLFKKAELQPHRTLYWLNAKPDELKEKRIDDICKVYSETSQKKKN